MADLPRRDQVPLDQTWDLGDLYTTDDGWLADLQRVSDDIAAVSAYRGRLGTGAATLLGCLQARDALRERLDRVAAYAQLGLATDGTSPHNQALAAQVRALSAIAESAQAFLSTELAALPPGVLDEYLAAEPGLATYRLQIEDIVRLSEHILSAETEEAIAALGEALTLPHTIWQLATAVDLRCAPVRDAAGREAPVSIAAYVFGLSQAPDRELRRAAYTSLAAGLTRHRATLSSTLAAHITRNVTLARLRHYASATEMLLDAQQVPEAVYHSVLDVVHDAIAPHVYRLIRLRQRLLGLERVYRYDLDAPLNPDDEPILTFADSARVIQEGLRPLGDEYGEILAAAFRERWIDRADNLGKRSGAFCRTVYGRHSFVFTTWRDTWRSAFVLAHELGHAGHGMLGGRSQVISNARPRMFAIEAPSTANEMLLGQHILATTADPSVRGRVILQLIGTFLHNMVTHLLEGHFERRLYALAGEGRPLTLATIMDVQEEVFERFYAGTVTLDEGARLYWAQQPHFYMNLYPYTYAAGLACGVAAAEAVRTEGQPAVERWLRMLRAGGTLPPLDLMRLAGVDLADAETLRSAVAYFGTLVDELEQSFV
jgi:oligoendopeptidase F